MLSGPFSVSPDDVLSEMPLNTAGRVMLCDFPQTLVTLPLVELSTRIAPTMMLLYSNRRVMALSFDPFVPPLTLNEVRSPVPLLQHPELDNPPTVLYASHSRLDLGRGLNAQFMPVILQGNAESLAFHTPAK